MSVLLFILERLIMQKNDIFEGKVIDYTHDGLGVVKIDNFPILLKML